MTVHEKTGTAVLPVDLGRERREHPPGTIVIPVADNLRHAEFFVDYSSLETPPGTKAALTRSASIIDNLNEPLRDMPAEHEWAWIMGDDHLFPSDLLMRLLDAEEDVVVPLCIKRTPPFNLVVMREEAEHLDERTGRTYPGFIPYQLAEVPDEPFTVVGAGSAGMLIRRRVLDEIGYPWFESTDGVYLNEDLTFCRKVRAAGFEIVCDPHALLGHIGQMHVWPVWHEGALAVKIDHGGPPGVNEIVIGDASRRPSTNGAARYA